MEVLLLFWDEMDDWNEQMKVQRREMDDWVAAARHLLRNLT